MRCFAFAGGFIFLVSCIFVGAFRSQDQVFAQQPGLPATKPIMLADGMIALSSDSADGKQQVVVIDTKSRVMSVYHIDHAGGMISLKSVRNITADFTLDEFNTGSPSPQDIRAMKNGRERR